MKLFCKCQSSSSLLINFGLLRFSSIMLEQEPSAYQRPIWCCPLYKSWRSLPAVSVALLRASIVATIEAIRSIDQLAKLQQRTEKWEYANILKKYIGNIVKHDGIARLIADPSKFNSTYKYPNVFKYQRIDQTNIWIYLDAHLFINWILEQTQITQRFTKWISEHIPIEENPHIPIIIIKKNCESNCQHGSTW